MSLPVHALKRSPTVQRRVEGRGMADEAGPSTSAFDAGHSSSHMDYFGGAAGGFTDADVDAFLREVRD